MRAVKYAFNEAVNSLWRQRASAGFSVATIAGAWLIVGAFLLVTTNLEQLLSGWSTGAEVSVYLRDDASEAQRTEIERLLTTSDIVEAREYVSKTEALARFKREFEDLASVASTLNENPFPASFEIRVRPEAVRSRMIDQLASRLAEVNGVADVRYDRRWLERLASVVNLLRGLVFMFALILAAGAALTVSNVVRLTLVARRDEIEIMQLVGAPASYLRGPFLAEGIIQGGVGAILALALLTIGYVMGRQQYGGVATELFGLSGVRFLPFQLCISIIVGGMVVGCLGGLLGTWGVASARPVAIATAEPVPAEAI